MYIHVHCKCKCKCYVIIVFIVSSASVCPVINCIFQLKKKMYVVLFYLFIFVNLLQAKDRFPEAIRQG